MARIIKLVNVARRIELIEAMEECEYLQIKETFFTLDSKGWQFLPVKQQRGRCYWDDKIITIPEHAFTRKDKDYLFYYIAHEMAHAISPRGSQHGPEFMAAFKEICPVSLQHFEIEYKPRNAIAAGISATKQINEGLNELDSLSF